MAHRYEVGKVLGEGTFGIVLSAIQIDTKRLVAIKQFKPGKFKDGVNFTALREMKLQAEIRHVNVTELLDVYMVDHTVHLVFEYLPLNLEDVIKCKEIVLSQSHVKSYLKMVLQGILECHNHWIVHRDLKPENLLCGPNGNIKIADFGLARIFGSPNRNMTALVCTIWYRPPELLFGAREYAQAVDMWGIGCILAELLLRVPIFAGNNEIDQLGKIFHVLGTPTDATWPGVSSLPNFIEFTPNDPMDLHLLFSAASEDAIDLLQKCFTFDPKYRITAAQALAHPYFSNEPFPTSPHDLPRPNTTGSPK